MKINTKINLIPGQLLIGTRLIVSSLTIVSGCGERQQPPKPETTPPTVAEAPKPSLPPSKEFYIAALEGKADIIKSEIARGVDVNKGDPDKRTALILAAFNGHIEIVQLLFTAGEDASMSYVNGRTALMFASSGPCLPTVELLLKYKPEINAKDSGESLTALMFAAAEGQT